MSDAWNALATHADQLRSVSLASLIDDPNRCDRFVRQLGELHVVLPGAAIIAQRAQESILQRRFAEVFAKNLASR